jgi:hypothetical protein
MPWALRGGVCDVAALRGWEGDDIIKHDDHHPVMVREGGGGEALHQRRSS